MNRYLLFRLYGPMAAWGDTAVGEYRPSHAQPSRTAILGLLAAALGVRRDQEEALNTLDRGVEIAVRLDMPGEVLRDYHTVQSPPTVALKGNWVRTRKDEIAALESYWKGQSKSAQASPISTRDYRTDAAASVALLSLHTEAALQLEQWQAALRSPALPLYLGRKSCPLALPLDPCIVEASNFKTAFGAYPGCDTLLRELEPTWPNQPLPEHIRYFWEGDDNSLQAGMSYPRRDRLISRHRWQFAQRTEHQASHPREVAADKES